MENRYVMEMLNRQRIEEILHTADRQRLIRQAEDPGRRHSLLNRALAWAAGAGAYAVQDGGRI
ncbi:MAG TPA: hypothetical protein VFJ45_00070, partial [bacterium]|nr:hypothetical protein [bacterium]